VARHILLIDDDLSLLASLSADLRERGYRIDTARSGGEAQRVLEDDPPDLVLLDLNLGAESGLDVLRAITARNEAPPVIMISGEGRVGDAVSALQIGALDFMEKPLGGDAVAHRVQRALRGASLARAHERLREEVGVGRSLLGESSEIRAIRETIGRVGPTDARVLIVGESGTGKELVARAIHDASPRAAEPFVALNASALPRDLVESELFGHQKGSFTGATGTRRGAFELASGGTLFLDEIGDMPLEAQPKLLRVLETGRVQRLGAEKDFPVDVRVVAATHRDLADAVTRGEFREDLFHRLRVVDVHVPALRGRADDIVLLARHFLAHFAHRHGRRELHLTPAAESALAADSLPGNVRELKNRMERVAILTKGPGVGVADVATDGGSAASSPASRADTVESLPALEATDHPLRDTLRQVERALVERTLNEAGGQKAETARRLGLERSHLYRKLRDLGIDSDE
jgi:two-component system nitrogen regulation response regulator NtrX